MPKSYLDDPNFRQKAIQSILDAFGTKANANADQEVPHGPRLRTDEEQALIDARMAAYKKKLDAQHAAEDAAMQQSPDSAPVDNSKLNSMSASPDQPETFSAIEGQPVPKSRVRQMLLDNAAQPSRTPADDEEDEENQ